MVTSDQTETFVRLLMRYERDLYRYVVSLLPRTAECDDVMQETASILWKKFSDYDTERPFLPWAMRFAYFEVLKVRRKKGRSRLIFSDELVTKLADEYPVADPLLESRRKALEECLGKLCDADRNLIAGRYSAGQTVRDLAESEGRPVQKLYYALEKIRKGLMECIERRLRKEGWDVGY